MRMTLQLPCLFMVGIGWAPWGSDDCSGRLVGIRPDSNGSISDVGINFVKKDLLGWSLQLQCERDFAGISDELGLQSKNVGATVAKATETLIDGTFASVCHGGNGIAELTPDETAASDLRAQGLTLDLVRGSFPPANEDAMRITVQPTRQDLHRLALAMNSALRAWTCDSARSSPWPGEHETDSDPDVALASAMSRVFWPLSLEMRIPSHRPKGL